MTAVVLAAGAGRRMGGRPKALLVLEGGETFLERAASVCRKGGCARIVAVIRPGVPELEGLVERLGLEAVENPEPERGMFSSVLLGLEAATAGDPAEDEVLVFPVDFPAVRAETVAALASALHEHPEAGWVQPERDGRGGHPLLLRRGTARAILASPTARTLREALAGSGTAGRRIPVPDPGVLRNVNYPKDLE